MEMDHRSAVIAFYDDVWNRRNKALVSSLCHEGFTFRGSLGSEKRGCAEFCDYLNAVTVALELYVCTVQALVVEADKAFAKVLFSGLHRAEFLGFPPTGKRVSWMGAGLFTFVGEKISDLWVLGDVDGLRRQLTEHAASDGLQSGITGNKGRLSRHAIAMLRPPTWDTAR
jgi:predicted ester cyclase